MLGGDRTLQTLVLSRTRGWVAIEPYKRLYCQEKEVEWPHNPTNAGTAKKKRLGGDRTLQTPALPRTRDWVATEPYKRWPRRERGWVAIEPYKRLYCQEKEVEWPQNPTNAGTAKKKRLGGDRTLQRLALPRKRLGGPRTLETLALPRTRGWMAKEPYKRRSCQEKEVGWRQNPRNAGPAKKKWLGGPRTLQTPVLPRKRGWVAPEP